MDPHLHKDISIIERSQRKEARFCKNDYNPTASVSQMIVNLNWLSLEKRREFLRLLLMYKMSHGMIDIDFNLYYLTPHFSRTNTRSSHNFKYKEFKATKSIYFNSYFPRTVRAWNRLPKSIVDSPSLVTFKSNLLTHLSN